MGYPKPLVITSPQFHAPLLENVSYKAAYNGVYYIKVNNLRKVTAMQDYINFTKV